MYFGPCHGPFKSETYQLHGLFWDIFPTPLQTTAYRRWSAEQRGRYLKHRLCSAASDGEQEPVEYAVCVQPCKTRTSFRVCFLAVCSISLYKWSQIGNRAGSSAGSSLIAGGTRSQETVGVGASVFAWSLNGIFVFIFNDK